VRKTGPERNPWIGIWENDHSENWNSENWISENWISEKWLFGKLEFGKLNFGKLDFGKLEFGKLTCNRWELIVEVTAQNPESNLPKSVFLFFPPRIFIFLNTSFLKSVFQNCFSWCTFSRIPIFRELFLRNPIFHMPFPETNIPNVQKLEKLFFKVQIPKSPKMAKIVENCWRI